MQTSKLLVFSALVMVLAACNGEIPTARQYDQLRVSLTDDKSFREKMRAECQKEFKALGPSAPRIFAVFLNVKDGAAMNLTCDRLIQGIIDKRLTYNDFANLMRLGR